jgi:hypothetical protein
MIVFDVSSQESRKMEKRLDGFTKRCRLIVTFVDEATSQRLTFCVPAKSKAWEEIMWRTKVGDVRTIVESPKATVFHIEDKESSFQTREINAKSLSPRVEGKAEHVNHPLHLLTGSVKNRQVFSVRNG